MAEINLIKRDWNNNVPLKKLETISRVLLVLAVGGFLLQVFYISGRLIYIRTTTSRVKNEINTLTGLFNSKKALIENYAWTQGVLEKYGKEKKDEYRYKDYLLEIDSWLTEGSSLVGVSFTSKDEIAFLVYSGNVDDYRQFETKLSSIQSGEGFKFKKIEQESLGRTDDGSYKVKIKLTI